MKKMYRILALVLSLCLLTLPVLAEELDDDEWEYEGGSETIAPEIELRSNPTTGYHWFFECDEPDVVEVVEHGFVSDNEELLGSGGVECFRLDGQEYGFAVVTFRYGRTVEEPLYTITYQLIVEENLDVLISQTSFEAN